MAATRVSRSTADFVAEYAAMPGKAMVAATDAMLTTAPPRPAGAHGAEGVLDAERGAQDVDVEHLADIVRIQVDDQARDLHAGVVDHDVQAAELGDRALDAPLPAAVV